MGEMMTSIVRRADRRAAAHPIHLAILSVLVLASVWACSPEAEPPEPETATESAEAPGTAPPVVEVRSTDYAFHAPSELPSGWTTLRMTNEGEEPHFLVIWLLPDGKDFDAYVNEVYQPFMDAFRPYKAGAVSRGQMLEDLGAALPEWLNLAEMGRGGVGIVSPGRTAETTLELAPGDYVMECYMVTEDGQVHNELGMLRPLTVTPATTGATPPAADVELSLSNSGITGTTDLAAGRHTVRVTVTETPEGLLGHDVHLARLDEATDVEDVVAWMDWIDGLIPPAPATFLGGAEQVPAGQTSYVTVELGPGRYVWISEGYAQQGLVEEFRVE